MTAPKQLAAALVALADAAEKVSEKLNIVQPFLDVYKTHGQAIQDARSMAKAPTKPQTCKEFVTDFMRNPNDLEHTDFDYPDGMSVQEIILHEESGVVYDSDRDALVVEGAIVTLSDIAYNFHTRYPI